MSTSVGPEDFFGDKYGELLANSADILAAGAHVAPMTGISQEVIDQELALNSLPTITEADDSNISEADIQDRLRISLDLRDYLVDESLLLQEAFRGPLIFRSSGRGDAVGVGVYKSELYAPFVPSIEKALAKVVGSYFSDAGRTYRERAQLEPGFGAFMQPVVGGHINGRHAFLDEASDPLLGPDLFFTPFSGNVRIGTPRNPNGAMRLQRGLGSAVDVTGAPIFDFDDDWYDDEYPPYVMEERAIYETSARKQMKSTEDAHLMWSDDRGEWQHDWEYNNPYNPEEDGMTFGALKDRIRTIHEQIGKPLYLEFAVEPHILGERLYVIQKAELKPKTSNELSVESIPKDKILLDDIPLEGSANSTAELSNIVCLTDDYKGDLYDFDQTEEAEGGYVLVYHAQSTSMSNRIDLTRLKNVKAIVDIETMDWGHSSRGPTDHLIGYSDQLDIPLMSIFRRNAQHEWQTLNGYNQRTNELDGEHRGKIIVRQGKFQVVVDPASQKALVVKWS